MDRPALYFDHAATTPLRSEALDAMRPHLTGAFGNPSSAHRWGRQARAALDGARAECARAVGAAPAEIAFVRGGTEADNMAVLGRAAVAMAAGERPLVVATAIEHPAVREACDQVAARGGESVRVAVDPTGELDDDALDCALSRGACVLSVMWVNNEVGTVLPVARVAARARSAGVVVHSDAVQAVGKVPVDFGRAGLDLASMTAHKIGGPRGVGLLYRRRGVKLAPLLFGGGQERRLRPGTEDVAGAVGLARALTLAVEEQAEEAERLAAERDRLQAIVVNALPGTRVFGAEGERAPHLLNLGFPGLAPAHLVIAFDLAGVAVSGGSACASGSTATSPVLRALYGEEAEGLASVRFSLGRTTTSKEVSEAANRTIEIVSRARDLAGVTAG
jgi:cysteine desulfurase